jgi:hypothetical protein
VHINRAFIQGISLHSWHTTIVRPVPVKMIMVSTTAMMLKKKKKNRVCHIDRHPSNQ